MKPRQNKVWATITRRRKTGQQAVAASMPPVNGFPGVSAVKHGCRQGNHLWTATDNLLTGFPPIDNPASYVLHGAEL